jgi:hypothetical protein
MCREPEGARVVHVFDALLDNLRWSSKSYLSVYRSIPRGTRGKDEDQRLYLKRRVQELLRMQDLHCGCKIYIAGARFTLRVQSIEVEGARALWKGADERVNKRVNCCVKNSEYVHRRLI